LIAAARLTPPTSHLPGWLASVIAELLPGLAAWAGVALLQWALWLRRNWGLRGEWCSCWLDVPTKTWRSEKVVLSVSAWSPARWLKLKGTSDLRTWEGRAKLVDRGYLTVTGNSTKPGARSSGAAVLMVASQGDTIYGYWMGDGDDDATTGGPWILGRDQAACDRAKKFFPMKGK
jgi:hypothetical protein